MGDPARIRSFRSGSEAAFKPGQALSAQQACAKPLVLELQPLVSPRGEAGAVIAAGCAESIPSRSRRSFPSFKTLAKPEERVCDVNLLERAPFFPLSKGRGRFGRPRPKSVRGLPRTQPWATQKPRPPDSPAAKAGARNCPRPGGQSLAAARGVLTSPAACGRSPRRRPRRQRRRGGASTASAPAPGCPGAAASPRRTPSPSREYRPTGTSSR